MNTKVVSASGTFLDLNNPKDFHIEDIAVGLGRTARFRGQTEVFYSVAEHCLSGAFYFIGRNKLNTALAFLLHDAAEAYISDIPTPFKNLVPGIRVAEEKIIHAIYQQWNVYISSDMSEEMKNVDTALACLEADRFNLPLTEQEYVDCPKIEDLTCLRFEESAYMYVLMFHLLLKGRRCVCS